MNYLIRLDDACPNMFLNNWVRIIDLLEKYNISAIIAAIPENRDPKFNYQFIENYNTILSKWNLNHEIAIHGYHHLYDSPSKPLYGFKTKSEFAGKDFISQKQLIKNGIKIFNNLKISPRVFVAPGHSFDDTTIDVIRTFFPDMIISDGMFLEPVIYKSVKFLPQQLANCKHFPFGTITFCYHPNTMSNNDFIKLERFLSRNSTKFIAVDDLSFKECSIFQLFFDKVIVIIKKIKYYVWNFSFK